MIDKPISYGRQYITDDDIAAVVKTLKSDFLTQGPKIKEFESNFATYCNAKYDVMVLLLFILLLWLWAFSRVIRLLRLLLLL